MECPKSLENIWISSDFDEPSYGSYKGLQPVERDHRRGPGFKKNISLNNFLREPTGQIVVAPSGYRSDS